MECESFTTKKEAVGKDTKLLDKLFSWSCEEIFDENLFKGKVRKIPLTFESVNQYFDSFVYPLLEETRAELKSALKRISEAPVAKVIDFQESDPYNNNLYDIQVDSWSTDKSKKCGKEPYRTLPGDILILAEAKPIDVSDLRRLERTWVFVSVTKTTDDESASNHTTFATRTHFQVRAAKDIKLCFNKMKKPMFVIFLTNIITAQRTWKSLHMHRDSSIIEEVLCEPQLDVDDENCELCLTQNLHIWDDKFTSSLLSTLNESQVDAINSCLRRIHCDHKPRIEIVWGPPGMGKTRTVSVLLFALLKMKYRTVICAPTNVAIKEVATRVLKLVKESFENREERNSSFCPVGDILLFGNSISLKVGKEIEDIFLDNRIQSLSNCIRMLTGQSNLITSMIDFLERHVSKNKLMEENKDGEGETKSFLKYVRERFSEKATPLKECISVFCTHTPVTENIFRDMENVISSLDSFETHLFKDDMVSEEVEEGNFSHSVSETFIRAVNASYLQQKRCECHLSLINLQKSLARVNENSLRNFCHENAALIFCTASSSYKLHSVKMKPLKFLVIDEAAQLKESEAMIPLHLPKIDHAILIGDEFQLSAMVGSKTSAEAGFGRSLFERLSSLDHSKHLLNRQYRMDPEISSFPNSQFYGNKLIDGRKSSNKKQYLPGRMFGPYSFINVYDGREYRYHISRSFYNPAEVIVVTKILEMLYQAFKSSKRNVSIAVIAPYTAQIVEIENKLKSKDYSNIDGFVVKVKTVDGFQGGEEDIIIISTVRSNDIGSVGFIANQQRTNVALTRARDSLWVLGNERTLTESGSVWKDLVDDAKRRQLFFDADEDDGLTKAITDVMKDLDGLDKLLHPKSILFRNKKWKVDLRNSFLKSYERLNSVQTKKKAVHLLQKLVTGWRPNKYMDLECERSLQKVKGFEVEDVKGLYMICTIDIVEQEHIHEQILAVWEILCHHGINNYVRLRDSEFVKYTDDYVKCCKEKFLKGKLELPKTWPINRKIVKYKSNPTRTNPKANSK